MTPALRAVNRPKERPQTRQEHPRLPKTPLRGYKKCQGGAMEVPRGPDDDDDDDNDGDDDGDDDGDGDGDGVDEQAEA